MSKDPKPPSPKECKNCGKNLIYPYVHTCTGATEPSTETCVVEGVDQFGNKIVEEVEVRKTEPSTQEFVEKAREYWKRRHDAIVAKAPHESYMWIEAIVMDMSLIMSDRLESLEAENANLQKAVESVFDLIAESYGVAGLHLNGDLAPWDELLESEWLEALKQLDATKEGK